VNQVATLFFLMPPVTAVIDYFVLGDALTPYKLAGVLAAALGVFLATRPPRVAAAPAQASAPAPSSRPRLSAPRPAVRRSCQAHGG
jgi:drug/metabolite transporter (DMT)-like permease